MFRQSVSEILGGAESAPPPGCEMGPNSPALLGLKHYFIPLYCTWAMSSAVNMVKDVLKIADGRRIKWHFTKLVNNNL